MNINLYKREARLYMYIKIIQSKKSCRNILFRVGTLRNLGTLGACLVCLSINAPLVSWGCFVMIVQYFSLLLICFEECFLFTGFVLTVPFYWWCNYTAKQRLIWKYFSTFKLYTEIMPCTGLQDHCISKAIRKEHNNDNASRH